MYFGIDIGGTKTRVGTFESIDSPSFKSSEAFPTSQNYEEEFNQICRLISRENCRVKGIGISIGAQVARDGSTIFASSNLPEYVNKPLVEKLSMIYECTVKMAHDCVCGLVAEKRFGEMSQTERFAYVTLSTGTGAAIHLKKDSNYLISSIELGHQIIDINGHKCLCGQTGCLETITGGKQIELRYGKPPHEISDQGFWITFTTYLASGLVNLARMTRIDSIVISGGIANNNIYVKENLEKELHSRHSRKKIPLFWSRLNEDSPIVGAVSLLQEDSQRILN